MYSTKTSLQLRKRAIFQKKLQAKSQTSERTFLNSHSNSRNSSYKQSSPNRKVRILSVPRSYCDGKRVHRHTHNSFHRMRV